MPSVLVTVALSLITLLLTHPTQATRIQDLFESALDTILCQNVEQMHETIIDIRTSIERGANLIDGKWVRNVDTCISQCCGKNDCDFALFKNEGASSSGKNCYFVNCGDKHSNCVMVDHTGFTSIVMGGRKKENGDDDDVSVQPTQPATTSPPTTFPPTTHAVTTVPPSPTSQAITAPPKPVEPEPATGSAPENPSIEHSDIKSDNVDKQANSDGGVDKQAKGNGDTQGNIQNTGAQDGGSGMIAVAIVGVVCFSIVVIVVGVLVRKIWTDRRRKRFRNVDYLINGMYT